MHYSDDEDSFQSADEDGFDQEQPKQRKSSTSSSSSSQSDKPDLKKSLDEGMNKPHSIAQHEPSSDATIGREEEKSSPVDNDESATSKSANTIQQMSETEQQRSPSILVKKNAHVADEEDEEEPEDDDEEALAERIRERNLKIAKKFSAEIARNNKASAPVPVEASMPIGFKVNDIEYPNIASMDAKSGLPPAPPPTPALSSSFNNLTDEQPSEPTMKSQYGWRLPPKTTPTSGQSKTGSTVDAPKGDQARQALDRLSANVSHSDKNLFEKLTADLKKVAIRSDDPPVPDLTASAPTLPSISDLGSTLGGWGWSGASKLLSSASQVTSQVGSVLDSVVNVSQHLQQSSDILTRNNQASAGATTTTTTTTTTKTSSDTQTNVGRPSGDSDKAPTKTVTSTPTMSSSTKNDSQNKGAESGEPLPSDPLVDFTLNAMESLGKKAFNVMTERDESGSLQIKGLGRPWEHLKKLNKSYQESKSELEQSERRESLPTRPKNKRETSRETIEYNIGKFDEEPETSASLGRVGSDKTTAVCDQETIPATLKQRKRFNHNDDNLD